MSAGPTQTDDVPLVERVKENPRPALMWLVGIAMLVALEFGALAGVVMDLVPWNAIVGYLPAAPGAAALAGVGDALASIPTLLSRELIPNQGYQIPGEGWKETFLGLPPAIAWFVRVALIYAYMGAWMVWMWQGYRIYRDHYRYADWTPRDDMVDRLRTHRWGQFGAVIVFMFIVMAMFAPAMGPTTVEQNIKNPYSYNIQYWDASSESVQEIPGGVANLQSISQGNADKNVGLMSYDDFGRFHPFGTLQNGKDLFTFMAAGARISLFIGLSSILIGGMLAMAFAMLTAYYKGLVDLAVVIVGDSIQSLPVLLLVILLSVVFADTWIGNVYNGSVLLIGIFSATYWPFLWRAVRGPAFQIADQEWIDAAKSYGQKPQVTMKKHMAPYVIGYMLVYVSMSLGGIIISVAALSFLSLGISPPTPEWGRAINLGQPYVATASWHISLIPGILITLVVTGFNALGDGIRDAIDPQSATGGSDASGGEVAATGGGA